MRKLILAVLVLAGASTASSQTQTELIKNREIEWTNYSVPKTPYVRHLGPDKNLIFRVPAEWKQVGDQMVFNGPHSSVIKESASKRYPTVCLSRIT